VPVDPQISYSDAMERKPKTKPPDDPKQYERLLKATEAAEAANTAKEAEKAFRSVVKPGKPKS
jgi:hypothetical protein